MYVVPFHRIPRVHIYRLGDIYVALLRPVWCGCSPTQWRLYVIRCALCCSTDRKVRQEWTGQLGLLEQQVEEQRRLAREFEQRSAMDSTRLQTMEQLLQKKEMEYSSMQRQLRSRPTPELSSYIEGYKIGMVGTTDTVRQISGGAPRGSSSMSQFLDDSKHTALPHSFLGDIDTIPSIGAEVSESEISQATTTTSADEIRGQTPADLLFAALDTDGDGVITKEEMRKGLSRGAKRSSHKRSRKSSGIGVGSASRDESVASHAGVKTSEPKDASGVGLLLAKSDVVRAHPVQLSASIKQRL
eukprot:COSAG02_NODE_2901_length_7778_cov_16.197161_3_plen_300_part_00